MRTSLNGLIIKNIKINVFTYLIIIKMVDLMVVIMGTLI
jgi:hypothetical protein